MFKNKKIITLLALSFLITQFTNAQSDRSPTPAEKNVILKAVNAVVPIIDRFQNKDWQKTKGGADEPEDYSVQKHPDVVMGVAPFNDWNFTIPEGSDKYNKIVKPYLDKMAANPPDGSNQKLIDEYDKEGAKMEEWSNVNVRVFVNIKNLPIKPPHGAVDLKIPGTFFSYKEPATGDKTIGGVDHSKSSYVLAFGNWSTAKLMNDNYQFHFTHPLATPYLENIVILIYGAPDRVQEILHNTDWKKINEGLTL